MPTVLKGGEPLYILDNVIVPRLPKIDSAKIFYVSVLKGDSATAIYGSRAINGVVLITTKEHAVKEYQKKLSDFSYQYKQYLERDKHKDNRWSVSTIYFINGKAFNDGQIETTTALYTLKSKDLMSVLVTDGFDPSYSPTKYYKIFITTKTDSK
jgi:TonB-dependent SusC/RagA subfamily outer membrane receptor